MYGKRTVGFFSLASHALWACEARALRASKTLTPCFTDFFTDFEKKPNCFAVYREIKDNGCANIYIYIFFFGGGGVDKVHYGLGEYGKLFDSK